MDDEEYVKSYNFILGSKEEKEIAILSRLFWYLNAGGRRSWQIINRPDELNRVTPSADFFIKEEKTGKEATVEVTSASSVKEGEKYSKERQLLTLAALEITTRITKAIGEVRGMYVCKDDLCNDPRDLKGINLAVSRFVSEYPSGQFLSFSVRRFGRLVYGSPRIEKYWTTNWEDEPGLGTDEEMRSQILHCLNEGNRKLAKCSGIAMLVIVINPIMSPNEFDICYSIERNKFRNIERLYIMDGFQKTIVRFR